MRTTIEHHLLQTLAGAGASESGITGAIPTAEALHAVQQQGLHVTATLLMRD